ncbi:MAG: type II secretion system protein GspL [Burkholderiaceae bacterium]
MSTLYLRIPSSATADTAATAAAVSALDCAFALAADDGRLQREGVAALSTLGPMFAGAQRAVLLLAASDVTLLQVKTPPLSGARLNAALPSLIEDQLVNDPADSVVVAGGMADGLRTVAVVRRDWLGALVQAAAALGARRVAAVPAQLCLPLHAEAVAAAVTERGLDLDLTVRLSPQAGFGLPVVPERRDTAALETVQTLRAMTGDATVALQVPPAALAAFEAVGDERIALMPDNWSHWIAGAAAAPINMVPGLGAGAAPGFRWRPWRWPLILAGLLLLVNAIALNLDWLRLRNEADALRAAMTRTYRTAYPKDTLIVDPLAQMRQKIAAARHAAGQPAPGDFAPLLAGFGDAWRSLPTPPAVAGVEYRDKALTVRLKGSGEAAFQPMKTALAARGLSLDQSAADNWQIRSAK